MFPKLFSVLLVSITSLASLSGKEAVEKNERTTPQKLGGIELPFVGEGSLGMVENEDGSREWIIGVKVSEAEKAELAWFFDPGEGTLDGNGLPKEEFVFAGGLDIAVDEDGTLTIGILNEETNAFHELRTSFWSDTGDGGYRVTDNEQGQVLVTTPSGPIENNSELFADSGESCAGGSCSCEGKCKACCPSGTTAYCNCSGSGTCRCPANKEINTPSQ